MNKKLLPLPANWTTEPDGHRRPDPVRPLEELAQRYPKIREILERCGRNVSRSENILDAESDDAAIQVWISEHCRSPHTRRAYQKEIERLRLWALIEREKPLGDLTLQDMKDYQAWLSGFDGPIPNEYWCPVLPAADSSDKDVVEVENPPKNRRRLTPGPLPRSHPKWRPFSGALTNTSQRQALVTVCSLFGYLHRKGYLRMDPSPEGAASLISRSYRWRGYERVITPNAWNYALEVLERLPDETRFDRLRKGRLRLLLTAIYELGARATEIATHPAKSLQRNVDDDGWRWKVFGKGEKTAFVDVSDDLVEAIIRYRVELGLPKLPPPSDPNALIPSFLEMDVGNPAKYKDRRTKKVRARITPHSLTPDRIYRIVRSFFEQVADVAHVEHPEWEDTFRRASTHWLRHMRITDLVGAGVSLAHAQEFARHSNITTTRLYDHENRRAVRKSILDATHARLSSHKQPRLPAPSKITDAAE